jgi:hypothetical protein
MIKSAPNTAPDCVKTLHCRAIPVQANARFPEINPSTEDHVCPRELFLTGGEELRLEALIAQLPLLEGLALGLQGFGLGATYGPSIILVVAAIKLFEIGFDALVDLREELRELVLGEVALCRVDRSELAAIDGDRFRTKEVQLLAQRGKGAADLSNGREVILAEVGYGLMIRPELLQQPHHFDIAVRLLLQATTRTQAVEIAVEVELQEITRGIAGSPGHSRDGSVEAAGC